MRFIDLQLLKPRIRHLLPALQEAQAEVIAETDPNRRAALIDRYRPRWVALREEFENFSSGKCWYVECKNPGTDNDIDHFRPKLGVKEDENHPGYYWLAFEWKNLRLSCHRANRPRQNPETAVTGGKADHFPLVPPSVRARGPADDLSREFPSLLDPTNPTDPVLLSYMPDGDIGLTPSFHGNPLAEAKFEASRIYLHLNWPKFRDGRLMLYNAIERTVDRGDHAAPARAELLQASEEFKNAIRDLVNFMDSKEEYSAAARCYVESFRHVWWVRDIVLRLPT
jgi:uncharacterized protein (TIGR02646 family)